MTEKRDAHITALNCRIHPPTHPPIWDPPWHTRFVVLFKSFPNRTSGEPPTHPPTHRPTHSPTHPQAYPPTHPQTCPLTHLGPIRDPPRPFATCTFALSLKINKVKPNSNLSSSGQRKITGEQPGCVCVCRCAPNFAGTLCEQMVTPCQQSSPCKNGLCYVVRAGIVVDS